MKKTNLFYTYWKHPKKSLNLQKVLIIYVSALNLTFVHLPLSCQDAIAPTPPKTEKVRLLERVYWEMIWYSIGNTFEVALSTMAKHLKCLTIQGSFVVFRYVDLIIYFYSNCLCNIYHTSKELEDIILARLCSINHPTNYGCLFYQLHQSCIFS